MTTKPKPRFLLMRAASESERDAMLADPSPVEALSDKYVRGGLVVVRRSVAQPELAPGDVLFDKQEGILHVHDGSEVHLGHPCVSCPDCEGDLVLRRSPERFERRKEWIYLCDRRDQGCRASCGAKADGTLQGIPANAETRRARRLTHEIFDRLWRQAPSVVGFRGSPQELRKATNEARTQAYRWFAHVMEKSSSEAHISHMDLETLRHAYRLCRDATPEEVAAFVKGPESDPEATPAAEMAV